MKIPDIIKTVIFDLDGLLINSEISWAEADKILLGKRGHTPTEELFVKRLGTGNKRTLEIYKEEFGMEDDLEKMTEERMELFYECLEKNLSLMDGAHDLITELFHKDKKLAIATSGSHRDKIEMILQKLKVDKFFSVVVTGQDVRHNKPAPDIFILAAEKLRNSPEESLVLEDAPNGVIAGKAAGMMVYAVNADKSIREELKRAGADQVFGSLSEITI